MLCHPNDGSPALKTTQVPFPHITAYCQFLVSLALCVLGTLTRHQFVTILKLATTEPGNMEGRPYRRSWDILTPVCPPPPDSVLAPWWQWCGRALWLRIYCGGWVLQLQLEWWLLLGKPWDWEWGKSKPSAMLLKRSHWKPNFKVKYCDEKMLFGNHDHNVKMTANYHHPLLPLSSIMAMTME